MIKYGWLLLLLFSSVHLFSQIFEIRGKLFEDKNRLALSGHYHAAQEGSMGGDQTLFAQTSAITRPDKFASNGFMVRSGFTVYEMENGKVVSAKFIPLNLPSN